MPEALPALPVALVSQLRYQARLMLRTPRAVVGGVLLPVLLLSLRDDGGPAQRTRTVAGLAVLGLLSTAYITHAAGLVAARQAGVLKRWRATPLPPWCWFAGRIGATVLLAVAGGAVTVIAGATLEGTDLPVTPGLVAVLVLGAATWASIGTAASALIPSAEAAWPLLALTYLPLVVLSGSFGPVSSEPGWLATVVSYLPAEPVVDGATRALRGLGAFTAHDAIVLVAWAAGGLLVAQRWFRWEPRLA
jgi:ABC-2 type transport system permease protein